MKKRKGRKRYYCENLSPIYKSIVNSKQNGKLINGLERIGEEFYINKQNIICKL